MFLRLILFAIVGYFIFRVVQLAGRMMSGSGKRPEGEEQPRPPEPRVPDYRDIKDADFIDITPKDKGPDPPAGS
ncbi:MAG TPA: hypothetical protein VL221_05425 [Bacteroidota bacterium]|nr:hypothetical protein [Bacteroidota bacterium]